MTALQQPINEVRTQETGSSSDENGSVVEIKIHAEYCLNQLPALADITANRHIAIRGNQSLRQDYTVMKILIGITGASGSIYTKRLLELLEPHPHEIHVVMSRYAKTVFREELAADFEFSKEIKVQIRLTPWW